MVGVLMVLPAMVIDPMIAEYGLGMDRSPPMVICPVVIADCTSTTPVPCASIARLALVAGDWILSEYTVPCTVASPVALRLVKFPAAFTDRPMSVPSMLPPLMSKLDPSTSTEPASNFLPSVMVSPPLPVLKVR